MTLAAGTKLGRYEIRSQLGAGGMGEVYLARDTQLDRMVALKILSADVARDQQRLIRFLQEARAASALSHPNVAHIYEIGEADGLRFIGRISHFFRHQNGCRGNPALHGLTLQFLSFGELLISPWKTSARKYQ